MAMAAAPSPRPVRPRPSVVVADRLTDAPARAADRACSASVRRGAILGRLPTTWTATLPMAKPASATSSRVRLSSRAPGASAHSALLTPNWLPRSPRPAAESSAEQIACAATSPSEWPTRPGSPGQISPARCNFLPSPNLWTSTPMPTRGAARPAGRPVSSAISSPGSRRAASPPCPRWSSRRARARSRGSAWPWPACASHQRTARVRDHAARGP